jgi:hypothetical protein
MSDHQQGFNATKTSRTEKMAPSVMLSNAEVGSSRMKMSGCLISAREIDARCFCPSDRLTPRSLILASYWSGKIITYAWIPAARAKVPIAQI